MALPPGARLGPYEILSPIGAGGMGEVYKARDTRLDRTVAIKVLPESFAADPDPSTLREPQGRRARFEREARTIAGLTHPYICTLYDIGEHELSNPESRIPNPVPVHSDTLLGTETRCGHPEHEGHRSPQRAYCRAPAGYPAGP